MRRLVVFIALTVLTAGLSVSVAAAADCPDTHYPCGSASCCPK